MSGNKFNQNELNYINANAFDEKLNIHISSHNLPDENYCKIVCRNLVGAYEIDLESNSIAFEAAKRLIKNPYIKFWRPTLSAIKIEVVKNGEFVIACNHGNCIKLVRLLREQEIENIHQNATLIQKDIISRQTNFGRKYNRESFYSTLFDCFNDGEPLLVDMSKSPDDKDVKYLQMMKKVQDKNKEDFGLRY